MTTFMPETAAVPAEPETAPAPEKIEDTAAPFGRYPSGRARKSAPKPKRARAASSSRPAASSSSKRAPTKRDYGPGIRGLVQVVCLPLAFTVPADAWAIDAATPGIAEALNDLAAERPEVAAMLDRLLQAGPYGALIGAVVPLAVQLAHNHGLLPAEMATKMGGAPKAAILAGLRGQAEAMQAQAARDAAIDEEEDRLGAEYWAKVRAEKDAQYEKRAG